MGGEDIAKGVSNMGYTVANVKNKISYYLFFTLAIITLILSLFLFIFFGWIAGLVGLIIAGVFYGITRLAKLGSKVTSKSQEEFNQNFPKK